jgi:ABC-type phosphate transport system substrate-binding protein
VTNAPIFWAALALSLAFLAVLIDYLSRSRQISYKILLENEPVDSSASAGEMVTALRVKNGGPWTIKRAIPFDLDGGRITNVQVTAKENKPRLAEEGKNGKRSLTSENVDWRGAAVRVPTVVFRPRSRFKLVVTHVGRARVRLAEEQHGFLPRVVDDTRTPPLTTARVLRGGCALIAGSVITIALWGQAPAAPVPAFCATGTLTLVGSTAFATTAAQLAQTYEAACRGATIVINAQGTIAGTQELEQDGASKSGTYLAMSDGKATPDPFSRALRGTPEAILIYALVANKKTGVKSVTEDQVLAMFDGKDVWWTDLGGARVPISLVVRDAASGTRRAFEKKILNRQPQPVLSSDNCLTKDRWAQSPVLLCEQLTTSDVLRVVNQIPGAIGYADVAGTDHYPNLQVEAIDGVMPSLATVERRVNPYPFWTTEYFYTYGNPPAGSIASSFLAYVTANTTAKGIMTEDGKTPCTSQNLMPLCDES